MKLTRLVCLVLCAAALTATVAFACDRTDKNASASASKASCSPHATTAANAVATKSGSCCASGATNATAAASAKGSSCGVGTATAAAKSAGCCMGASAAANCDMKGVHGACAVCSDEATCGNDLRSSGVRSQVVALRNGAMLVYSADAPEGVRALQATVARFNDHIMNAYNSGSATLCGGCKTFRGAMASGKFVRELVNVKNGCQVLLTSTDRSLVRRIHDMTGAQMAVRVRD